MQSRVVLTPGWTPPASTPPDRRCSVGRDPPPQPRSVSQGATNVTRRLSIVLLATCACGSPRIQPTAGKGPAAGSGSGGQDAGFTISYPDATPLPPPMPGKIPDDSTTCAGETHQATMVPLDLLFLLDISGSMEESAGTQSKWVALRQAVLSFVKDGKSAGLGVGMETFPPPAKICGGDADCGAQQNACEQK